MSLLSSLHSLFSKKIPADRAGRGIFGEKQAASYLRKAGFRILARNWRAGHDEIDLVCQEGELLVFVEVRTRDHTALVSGYHSVTKQKKAKLRRVCRAYINSLRSCPAHYRFDIVEVRLGPGEEFELNHHPNVCLFTN